MKLFMALAEYDDAVHHQMPQREGPAQARLAIGSHRSSPCWAGTYGMNTACARIHSDFKGGLLNGGKFRQGFTGKVMNIEDRQEQGLVGTIVLPPGCDAGRPAEAEVITPRRE